MKPSTEFQRNPRLPLMMLALMGVLGHGIALIDATPPFPIYHRNIRIALVIMSVVMIWLTRALKIEDLKRAPGVIIFFLLSAPYLLTNWITNSVHLSAGVPWEPYRLHVFFYVTLGILVPISPFYNFIMIVLFTVQAIAMWFMLDIGSHPNANLSQQPVLMILWIATSCILLYTRARDQKLMYELSDARAKNDALKSVARVFLTLRDRANTPLQTLEISAVLLEKRFPETSEETTSIRRSVKRLSEINQIMAAGATLDGADGKLDELLSDEELRSMLRLDEKELG